MDGGNECMEGVGEFPVNASNYLLSASGQTNPCRSSILNLGDTPRLVSAAQMSQGACRVPGVLPRVRRARKSCPSQAQVLAVLLKCLPGDFRAGFGESFSQYVTEPGARALHAGEPMLCMTPVRWIWGALHGLYAWFPGGAELPGFHIEQLGSLEDVFYQSEVTTPFHHDFIVMDVILNRSYVPVVREHAIRAGTVVPVGCSGPEEIADCADGSFRTVIAIIPSAGAFYCARERRSNAVGRANSLIPLDLSWLRLASGSEFGQGGYVKRLHHRSSAWRVSLTVRSHIGGVHQHRLIRCARQLHDADGPALPPDVFDGSPCEWSAADRAALYNLRLAGSNSVRYGGGHYAVGCHYFCVSADDINPRNGTEEVCCWPLADKLKASLIRTKTPRHSILASSFGRLSARFATLFATSVKSRKVTFLFLTTGRTEVTVLLTRMQESCSILSRSGSFQMLIASPSPAS